MQYKFTRSLLNTLIISLCCHTQAHALPDLNNVAHGNVNIAADANSLQVTQATEKAIMNWNSFNIDAHESVKFQQPHNGVCLNRVDAASGMSQIAGNLDATGRVLLINQAGILFSDSAQVNIGSLIASTTDLADQNFLQEHTFHDLNLFFDKAANYPGVIINRGLIQVHDRGGVVFLGQSVNEGIIKINSGTVSLATGEKYTLDIFSSHISVAIESPISTAATDENGVKLTSAINVPGKIIAEGGEVYIQAISVDDIFDNLINLSGEVRAKSVVPNKNGDRHGQIILEGDQHGTIQISGTLDVAANDGDMDGGLIAINSNKILIADNANIDASGNAGGGLIVIGNIIKFKGDPSAVTDNVYIAKDAVLNVNANVNGGAGDLIVMAANKNKIAGTLSAHGGTTSGDGGNVTILSLDSAKIDISKANIDVSASNGNAGMIAVSK